MQTNNTQKFIKILKLNFHALNVETEIKRCFSSTRQTDEEKLDQRMHGPGILETRVGNPYGAWEDIFYTIIFYTEIFYVNFFYAKKFRRK